MSQIAWVTGARGFIGRHVARHLANAGAVVHGVGHGIWPVQERRKWGLREWINGDISAGSLSTLATMGGKPAVVMHLAGGSSVGFSVAQPREDFARTVAGTAELLDWLRLSARQARLVASP